ncbi:LEA type 2 family protein [Halobacterium zhouii]|uniref:LEA type 2 family protein n=1 Tax=Halobacterium zhouii TaxID=2902624 RepID=UPI001E447AC3|nr:LEA type 2 family protein [Halobacterium zhouii]
MDVRALLLGSTLRVAVTSILGVGLVVSGAFFAGILGVPSVATIDNEFGAVNESRTAIQTDLVVHNPNPIGVRLGDLTVEYAVAMNGIEMASGAKHGIGIGTGNSTVNLTTDLQNERIPDWWASHVKNGERTNLTITATAHSGLLGRSATFQPAPKTIRTDVISQFNSSEDRPVNAGVPLVEDPIMVIEETNASWGTVTKSETPIQMEFDVYNPKTAPVAVTNVGYNITMNGVLVGQGEVSQTESIPGHTRRTIETPTVIDNERLDEWWVSHLRNNQTTELRIDFYAEVEPPGTTEPVRVPLRELTYTRTIETDIFGSKAAGDASSDGTENSTGDGQSTTTDESTTTAEETTTSDTTTQETTTSDTTTQETTTSDTTTTTDDGVLARRS